MPGENAALDLMLYHTPNFYAWVVRWYYAAPAIAVIVGGLFLITVWRVWFEDMGGNLTAIKLLPPWPLSPEAADAVVSRHLHGGVTDSHGSVTQVGSDQPTDIVVAGYLARGEASTDAAAVGPDQTADVVRSRHLDRNHLQVPDDGGGPGLAEQTDIVFATIDKQISDVPTVALEDRSEAREAAG